MSKTKIWYEYIAAYRPTDNGGEILLKRKLARFYHWLPVIKLWLKIVWREGQGGTRIDAKTAWQVAEGVHGIIREGKE